MASPERVRQYIRRIKERKYAAYIVVRLIRVRRCQHVWVEGWGASSRKERSRRREREPESKLCVQVGLWASIG